MKTTSSYPLTKEQCESRILEAVKSFGPNQALKVSFGYRKNGFPGTGGGTIAFSFVESPRTKGAYKEIGFCS